MTNRFRNKASALVTTLFVLVVLSTIVVAFLASMNLERKIAQSTKNKYQAELAAEAGLAEAIGRIYETTRTGPYAAVYLTTTNSPYLFLAKREFSANGTVTRRIPLFSTRETNFAALTNFSAAFLGAGNLTLSDIDANGSDTNRTLSGVDVTTNINATNSAFPFGLVGLRNSVASTNHPTIPVDWIYLRNAQGKVIGRYAFWTDDECSKLDLRFAGNSNNITGNHTRANGASFSEISLLSLTNLPGVTSADLANLLSFQTPDTVSLPLTPGHLTYSLAEGVAALNTNDWQTIRPYVTIYSKHDDRSLDGKRRIDLNELIASPADVTTQTLAIRAAITNNLPLFGQRFYSAPATPPAAHQKVYATRIAANIRDFIDADSASTIILPDDSAYVGNGADFVAYEELEDDDLPLAFGKECGLALSEYLLVVRTISPLEPPEDEEVGVSVRFRFAHYVEVANISQEPITYNDLGADPHILIGGRKKWINDAPTPAEDLRLSDVKIRFPTNFSLQPGQVAYLTTDGPPWTGKQSDFVGDDTNNQRYVIQHGSGPGQWELVNTNPLDTPIESSFVAGFTVKYEDYIFETQILDKDDDEDEDLRKYLIKMDSPGSAAYTDQSTRIILANNSGIIDCAFRVYVTLSRSVAHSDQNPVSISTFLNDPEATGKNQASNSTKYTRGDLRSNMDIITTEGETTALAWKYGSTSSYGDAITSNNQITLGAVNWNYDQLATYRGNLVAAWRKGWYEYTTDPAGNHFQKNSAINSVADLGFVYDPVRHDIAGYRSMGATLRFGQSDSATNNRATNSAIDYQNWLGGRGSDDATNAAYGKNAVLLMDVFRTDTNTSGRINPNSVVRDRTGVVMRAALGNYTYESQATNGASTLLAGKALNETNTFTAIQSFATNASNGFLVSVGDLSRVPAFWNTNNDTSAIVPGTRMSSASDSGKEEFLRRTANLLTTQSLAYSVFVVAQAGSIQSQGGTDRFVPISSITTESVIQLDPTYPSSPPETPPVPSAWKILKPRTIFH